MTGNERSRPLSKAGPATTDYHHQRPPSVTRPDAERWVFLERQVLREAMDYRVELWLALGLRVPRHDDDLAVARAQVAVDHALRKAAS